MIWHHLHRQDKNITLFSVLDDDALQLFIDAVHECLQHIRHGCATNACRRGTWPLRGPLRVQVAIPLAELKFGSYLAIFSV